ncbi:unnamed protein product [Camellia sinensis]
MAQEIEKPRKVQYPHDSTCYKITDEIGRGVSAIVYKAICIPNSTVVAIKSIDLDRSRTELESVRLEAKIMSLLSHPNILRAHCSFMVDHRLWVVMPFMSSGSLQSIMTSSFPDGLSEPCIAVVLRETLNALSYLHNQGHLHRDIKAGNILIDSNGSVKLADFGVSASIYESNSGKGSNSGTNSASGRLTDLAGTPYWMAPEVIHSHTGYSFKADIWSFGITALELAHGRPPLSHLPPSKSLIMKITKRYRFSDYDRAKNSKNKKFSKNFKDMVGLCLDQDPSKRPSAEKLLKHSFFKNCKNSDFLSKNLLVGLPSVEQRFREIKLQRLESMNCRSADGDDEDDQVFLIGGVTVKQRRISGWNFNEDGFELDPVFPVSKEDNEIDNDIVKQVRFGGETIIRDRGGESEKLNLQTQLADGEIGGGGGGGSVDRDVMMGSLMFLKKSLDDQRQKVMNMIDMINGEENVEMSRELQLMQVIENLKMELENVKKRNFELEMELGVSQLTAKQQSL